MYVFLIGLLFHTVAGEFIQYDTIVYPRCKARSSHSIQSYFTGIISTSQSKEKEHSQFTVSNCSNMLEMSLDIHLQPFRNILLQGNFSGNYCISEVANEIICLFKMFMSRVAFSTYKEKVVPWRDNSVNQVRRCKFLFYGFVIKL